MIDIYVINLKERIDRWHLLERTFAKFRNINLIRIEAVKYNPGFIGCSMSHIKCLEYAKKNNMDNILVIEDDCVPYDDTTFEKRLIEFKNYLDENSDWDIFLGGTCKVTEADVLGYLKLENNYLLKINNGHMTHMIGYNKRVYDFLSI